MVNNEKTEKQKSDMEKLNEILNRKYKIPNVKSNFFDPERHIDACQVLEAAVTHIKNKNDIKENIDFINSIFDGLMKINGTYDVVETLGRRENEIEDFDLAISKALGLYSMFSLMNPEDYTEEENLEIVHSIPYIDHLLKLKLENYGATIVEKESGGKVVDWNEKDGFIVDFEGNGESDIRKN